MGSFPNKWMVFLLAVNMAIAGLDRGNLAVANPIIMKELHINPEQMGMVLSAFFWAYALSNIPGGMLIDRFGTKRVYAVAGVIWTVATFLTGFVNSLYALILCRLLLGLSEGVLIPTASKINNENFAADQRGTVTGLYMGGLRVGLIVTPIAVAWIISQWGWTAGFIFSGIVSLIGLLLWYFTFPKNIEANEKQVALSSGQKYDWAAAKGLLKDRNALGAIGIKYFDDVMAQMLVSWLPGYLVMERGFTLMKMGIYASLPWIASLLGMSLIGIFSDYLIKKGKSRTFARKVPLVTCQLLALTIVFTPWIESGDMAVWLLIFVMGCQGGMQAVTTTLPSDIAARGAGGLLGGMVNTATSFAGITGTLLTGFLVKATGSFAAAFVMAAISIFIAMIFTIFVMGEIKQMAPAKQAEGKQEGSSV